MKGKWKCSFLSLSIFFRVLLFSTLSSYCAEDIKHFLVNKNQWRKQKKRELVVEGEEKKKKRNRFVWKIFVALTSFH